MGYGNVNGTGNGVAGAISRGPVWLCKWSQKVAAQQAWANAGNAMNGTIRDLGRMKWPAPYLPPHPGSPSAPLGQDQSPSNGAGAPVLMNTRLRLDVNLRNRLTLGKTHIPTRRINYGLQPHGLSYGIGQMLVKS